MNYKIKNVLKNLLKKIKNCFYRWKNERKVSIILKDNSKNVIFIFLFILFSTIIAIFLKYFNSFSHFIYAEQKLLKKQFKPYTSSIFKYIRKENVDAKKVYNIYDIINNILTFLAVWYNEWKKTRKKK
jgi:hypothetical protein